MKLVDTHAHLHFQAFGGEVDQVLLAASQAGVGKIINVGVDTQDSKQAVELAAARESVWAAVGVHPHAADEGEQAKDYIAQLAKHSKVVAIGECGLDRVRSKTAPSQQETCLRWQIQLAVELDLPVIFHVREAFTEFWPIFDSYEGVRGVVHSFSDNPANMRAAVDRGLMVGLNGIMTFTKDEQQLQAAKALPQENLVLETDCPYLAPAGQRGKRNQPSAVAEIAEFLAQLRGEPAEQLAQASTNNAEQLFNLPTGV